MKLSKDYRGLVNSETIDLTGVKIGESNSYLIGEFIGFNKNFTSLILPENIDRDFIKKLTDKIKGHKNLIEYQGPKSEVLEKVCQDNKKATEECIKLLQETGLSELKNKSSNEIYYRSPSIKKLTKDKSVLEKVDVIVNVKPVRDVTVHSVPISAKEEEKNKIIGN